MENQADSWLCDSENQGTGQRFRYKCKSYQHLLTPQYVMGEDPERDEGQGEGTIQKVGVQQRSPQKETDEK